MSPNSSSAAPGFWRRTPISPIERIFQTQTSPLLYRVRDAERTLLQFKTGATAKRLNCRAMPVHCAAPVSILSGDAQIDIGGKRLVFSGDWDALTTWSCLILNQSRSGLHHHRGQPWQSSSRPFRCRRSAKGDIIERTTRRGGVVIPAFAVGRAQSLIYDLWLLRQRGGSATPSIWTVRWPPAQLRCCTAMPTTTSSLNTISRRHSRSHMRARRSKSPKALSANRYPKVIISASGRRWPRAASHRSVWRQPSEHAAVLWISGSRYARANCLRALAKSRSMDAGCRSMRRSLSFRCCRLMPTAMN